MRELTRRDALASATALGAVVIAGCVAENDDEPDDNDDDPEDGNDGEAGDDIESLELIDTDLETTAADCGSDDVVEASVVDGDIVLEGTVPASNPCHEAYIDEATLENDELSVVVEIEDTTDEDEGCIQCTGVIDYEATLEFSEELEDLSPFDSFTVEHGGTSGEVHVIEEAGEAVGAGGSGDGDQVDEGDDSGESGGIDEYSIETTEAGCTNETPAGDEPERVDAADETEFSVADDTVTVDGALLAPNPCYEPYIESASYEDEVLSLVIATEIEEEQYCQDCIGEIQYEATVSLTEGTVVEDVSVTHIQ